MNAQAILLVDDDPEPFNACDLLAAVKSLMNGSYVANI
jgi:hypothetical protein